jgi:hypothetical protein
MSDEKKSPVKITSKIVGFKVLKKEDPIIIAEAEPAPVPKQAKRPEVLDGKTYKIVNGAEEYNLYMTINYLKGKPFEIFFDSSNTEAVQWIKAFSRMASMVLRSHDVNLDLRLIAEQLMKCPGKGYFAKGMGFVPGIVVHIGRVLLDIVNMESTIAPAPLPPVEDDEFEPGKERTRVELKPGKECPECHKFTLIKEGGCTKCSDLENCGYMGECG